MYYDIVIIGNGLVGGVLCASLTKLQFNQKNNIKIAIVEKRDSIQLRNTDLLDNRGIILNKTSIDFFCKLGLWDKIKDKSYPIKNVHISEQNKFGCVFLNSNKFDLPFFGCLIQISELIKVITNQNQTTNITFYQPDELINCQLNKSNTNFVWDLELRSTKKISSKLLIAADGTDSIVRKLLTIPTTIKVPANHQSALVANLDCKIIDTAYQRFTQHGIYAFLPFGEKTKFVFSSDSETIINFVNQSESKIRSEINQVISGRINKISKISDLITYDLKQINSLKIIDKQLILIGNSANTLHPAMAQGYNLAIRDIIVLYDLFKNSVNEQLFTNSNIDFILNKYKTLRIPDHKETLKYTNSIKNIFDNKNKFINVLRGFGLGVVNLLPDLKNKIVQQGIGTICQIF